MHNNRYGKHKYLAATFDAGLLLAPKEYEFALIIA